MFLEMLEIFLIALFIETSHLLLDKFLRAKLKAYLPEIYNSLDKRLISIFKQGDDVIKAIAGISSMVEANSDLNPDSMVRFELEKIPQLSTKLMGTKFITDKLVKIIRQKFDSTILLGKLKDAD